VNGCPNIPLAVFQPSPLSCLAYFDECSHAVSDLHSASGHPEGCLPARGGRDDRVDVDDLPFLGFGRLTETAGYIGKGSMARQPLAPA
jgi:hypothetical protein